MEIRIHCKYCGHNFGFDGPRVVDAPGRDFMKVNCPECNSRMALDICVRAKGKSAAIKKKEAKRKQAWEDAMRAVFETTDLAGSGQTWLGLDRQARDTFRWKYSSQIEKKFEEAGYRR